MSFNLDSLFIEWRRIVPTGVPNPKNAYHLTLLKEICLSKGISTEIVDSVMLVMEKEEKFTARSKKTGNVSAFGSEEARDKAIEDGGYEEVEKKDDEEKEEPDTSKLSGDDFKVGGEDGYLSKGGGDNDDIESKEEKPKDKDKKIDYWGKLDKLSDEAKEVRKAEYLEQQLDFLAVESSIPAGKGRFRLSSEDVDDYKKYLNDLSTPEKRERWMNEQKKKQERRIKEFGEVTNEDVDDFIDVLKDKLGGKEFTRLKNSIMKKGDPPKDLINNSRFKEVVKSYIETGGVSPITNKRVPFSETQLDHITSLGNGGKDEASNWMFMEERFNQYKGKKTDEDVRANLEKDGYKTPSEYDAEVEADKFENSIIAENRAFWKTQFEKFGSDIHLTEDMLESMSADQINDLVKGYNDVYPDNQIARYPARSEKFTMNNGEEIDLSINRDGFLRPVKDKPETWGLKKNYETNQIEKTNANTYEEDYNDFKKGARAGGGGKKKKPDFIKDLLNKGLAISKETSEGINTEIKALSKDYESGQVKRKQDIKNAIKAAKDSPGSMKQKEDIVNSKMKQWDSENPEPESVAGLSKKAKEMNSEYLKWKEMRDIARFNTWKEFDPYSQLRQ